MSLDGVVDISEQSILPYFDDEVVEMIQADQDDADAILLGRRTRTRDRPDLTPMTRRGRLDEMREHDRGQTTRKAYWVNTFRAVSDHERLADYVELAGPVMREFGGRFLARGQPARAFEAGVMERTVVIEFESVEQAVAAYESPGYQRALRALGDGAQRDIRIIEAAS